MRALYGILVVALALAGGFVALVLTQQRSMMFPAPPVSGRVPQVAGLERDWVDVDGAPVEVWLLPGRAAAPTPWLVFAHGNGELIDHWAAEFEPVRNRGVGVALVEYPGYGRSGGRPSERSIERAMVAAYDRLVDRPDVRPDRIVGWGRSLGGGAVCALARRRKLAALVLESAFTSVRPLAARMMVPGLLVRDPFDNEAVVREFDGPLLVVHGDWDALIPPEHSDRLAAVAADAKRLRLPCGHNDCPRYWPELFDFLAGHSLLD